MKRRAKTPDEKLADLVRGYGSFAEAGRRFASSMGVKPTTAAKYIAQATRRERAISKQLQRKIQQKTYYEQIVKPRRQIRAASSISDKIEIALRSKAKQIELKQLLPEGTTFFGFDFQDKISRDARFKFVREAIEKGLRISVNAIAENDDGRVGAQGTIGGTDSVKSGKGKRTTKRYISEMYHIMRRAYGKIGAVSWVVSGFNELGDVRNDE